MAWPDNGPGKSRCIQSMLHGETTTLTPSIRLYLYSTPFYGRFWKYRTKFRSSAVNFDNTAQCTVVWKQCKHFGVEKPLFVIVQPISAEVHEDFVIVQYSAKCRRFRQCSYEIESKILIHFLQFDTYISTEYLLAYLKTFIS